MQTPTATISSKPTTSSNNCNSKLLQLLLRKQMKSKQSLKNSNKTSSTCKEQAGLPLLAPLVKTTLLPWTTLTPQLLPNNINFNSSSSYWTWVVATPKDFSSSSRLILACSTKLTSKISWMLSLTTTAKQYHQGPKETTESRRICPTQTLRSCNNSNHPTPHRRYLKEGWLKLIVECSNSSSCNTNNKFINSNCSKDSKKKAVVSNKRTQQLIILPNRRNNWISKQHCINSWHKCQIMNPTTKASRSNSHTSQQRTPTQQEVDQLLATRPQKMLNLILVLLLLNSNETASILIDYLYVNNFYFYFVFCIFFY